MAVSEAELESDNPWLEILLDLTERARVHAAQDPFGNPVLAVALSINRYIDENGLREAQIAALIRDLRDRAFERRAQRLAAYAGLNATPPPASHFIAIAQTLARPDVNHAPLRWSEYRAQIERTRFAAVFTAHPTFAIARDAALALAAMASGENVSTCLISHRPQKPTLTQEFEQAMAAIANGRDALDDLMTAILSQARATYPEHWAALSPRPIVISSWVGFDTDGRNDIGWWDSLRFRLMMKQAQIARILDHVRDIPAAKSLAARLEAACEAVQLQVGACPKEANAEAVANFAQALIGLRKQAILDPEDICTELDAAIAVAPANDGSRLAVARAGLCTHGLGLAHTHVRLNSTQIHNAIRLALNIVSPAGDRAQRRGLLTALNAALASVAPVAVDFGALLSESASATRLMMMVAQIIKHIDCATPIRFLIAETESGATLLSALWLAKQFGIEKKVEISPLFETAQALEGGVSVLEEALRSSHYRAYLKSMGKLALQFGYSDSGRYVGQLAASYLIERLRLKLAELLRHHKLLDVELILFDTHGESIGRGAHPRSMIDRLRYLSPAASRVALHEAGIRFREESAFQGGDGYLLFGTKELAAGTIAQIARHALMPLHRDADPIYAEPGFSGDFFMTIAASMQDLVEDPGYAALLGAFGPALLDPTGSRPAVRQSDIGGPALIRHPRELRAIPNNAILQQLGWCANTLQGVGSAAARSPEIFTDMREGSPRFQRALDFAAYALQHSDLDVLRAVISLMDPGSWLDRAAQAKRQGRAKSLADIAEALENLHLWAPAQAMFRKIQMDHLHLRQSWRDAPRMSNEEMLLHSLRIALVGRIWLLGTAIPEFSPQHGVTREAVFLRILQLDIAASLKVLAQVFPKQPDRAMDFDFGEQHAPRAVTSYAREHETIFAPIERLFALVREIGTAITHNIGAFG